MFNQRIELTSGFNLFELMVSAAVISTLSLLGGLSLMESSVEKAREKEAEMKVSELLLTIEDLRMTDSRYPEVIEESTPLWDISVRSISKDKAIVSAAPKDGIGRSLTTFIEEGRASQFCWADVADVTQESC